MAFTRIGLGLQLRCVGLFCAVQACKIGAYIGERILFRTFTIIHIILLLLTDPAQSKWPEKMVLSELQPQFPELKFSVYHVNGADDVNKYKKW